MPLVRLLPFAFLLLLASLQPAAAQETTLPDYPVRYDDDYLSPEFHESRREAVLEALPEGAVAVFFSAPEHYRAGDVEYEYHQQADLYYLTGSTEPGTVLLLAPDGLTIDGRATNELLLVPPRTNYSELWLGRRFGPDRAERVLGVDQAITNERFEEILTPIIEDERRIHHLPLPQDVLPETMLGRQLAFFTEQTQLLDLGTSPFLEDAVDAMLTVSNEQRFREMQEFVADEFEAASFGTPMGEAMYHRFLEAESLEEWEQWRRENIDARHTATSLLEPLLTQLRMVKTDEEMELLRNAIEITADAHGELMRAVQPGMHEYEIEGLIDYVFKTSGAEREAFPSIVASGENSTILHYTTNRRQMQAEDLLLVDIGAEYRGYAADVTRTLPVDGSFSPEQRAIYELVLEAQQAGIEAAQPGAAFRAPDQAARRVITEGLRELGLIENRAALADLFPHGTSHYLGLHVHDVGTGEPLAPGHLISVEPGIYIRPSEEIDERWWNIGVRIEDDILITEDGPEVLSDGAPRSVEEIEALMREQTAVEF